MANKRAKTVKVKPHKRSKPDDSKINNPYMPKIVPIKRHKRAKPKNK